MAQEERSLKGLTFSGAKAKKDEKTGKKIWTPFTRPLAKSDIMSESKDGMIITTKDGKKYDLSKVETKKSESIKNDNPDGNPDGKTDGNPAA